MKKITGLCILLAGLSLAACAGEATAPTVPATLPEAAGTQAPATTTPAPPEVEKVGFSLAAIEKKYYADAEGYVELDLRLPVLSGSWAGIPAINAFFADKEQFFYDQLPFGTLRAFDAQGRKTAGKSDNCYRLAHYRLEAQLGGILSVSADLDGGAGGVGWAGIEGDTFDLNTGRRLDLADLFAVDEAEYLGYICDFVAGQATEKITAALKLGHGSPYNFEDVRSEAGAQSIRQFDPNDFYLTETALAVFYPKYALACGAAGPQVFEIPYAALLAMLKIAV